MNDKHGQIHSHAQARTAEKYMDLLNEQILDETLALVDLQFKHYEIQIIQIELDHFHENLKIQLVIDNTINKEGEMIC